MSADPKTTEFRDRRRVKRDLVKRLPEVLRTDEWLRNRMRTPRHRERMIRQSVQFGVAFGLDRSAVFGSKP